MPNSDLPTKFRLLRKYLEYSQENIADEVGISPEVYGKIERGQTPITEERLRQISAALGFESWDMLRLSADELLLVLINRKIPPPKE